MERKDVLMREAIERFGIEVFEGRIFFNKFPLLERMYDVGYGHWLFSTPALIKGISHEKGILSEALGFKYKFEHGCEVFLFDGQIIYFDGLWAEVRKPTENDFKKEEVYDYDDVKNHFYNITILNEK